MMIVYWCEYDGEHLIPRMEEFEHSSTQIIDVLDYCTKLRQEQKLFITTMGEGISSDIVRDSKLPNGQPYNWKKRRL